MPKKLLHQSLHLVLIVLVVKVENILWNPPEPVHIVLPDFIPERVQQNVTRVTQQVKREMKHTLDVWAVQ